MYFFRENEFKIFPFQVEFKINEFSVTKQTSRLCFPKEYFATNLQVDVDIDIFTCVCIDILM